MNLSAAGMGLSSLPRFKSQIDVESNGSRNAQGDDRAETAHAFAKTHTFESPSSLQLILKLGNTPHFLPSALNS